MGEPSDEAMELKHALQRDMPFNWAKIAAALQKLIDERDKALWRVADLEAQYQCVYCEQTNRNEQRAEAAEKERDELHELIVGYKADLLTMRKALSGHHAAGKVADIQLADTLDRADKLLERAEAADQRVAALEAKCDLLAASLKQADARSVEAGQFERAAIATKAQLVRDVREWSAQHEIGEVFENFEDDHLEAILERHASGAEHPDTARLRELVREVTVCVSRKLGDDAIYAILNSYDTEAKP